MPQVDLYAERIYVRETRGRNLYTGKTYNSVENIRNSLRNGELPLPDLRLLRRLLHRREQTRSTNGGDSTGARLGRIYAASAGSAKRSGYSSPAGWFAFDGAACASEEEVSAPGRWWSIRSMGGERCCGMKAMATTPS